MPAMTKRRLIRWSLILAVLAAFAIWLEPTRVVWGWLRGEAFYQGRPTCYWRTELDRWSASGQWFIVKRGPGYVETGQKCMRAPSLVDRFMQNFVELGDPTWPALLDADPRARSVLEALLNDSNQRVSNWARFGLDRIRTGEKGNHVPAGTIYTTIR